jgi:hypothetical protein
MNIPELLQQLTLEEKASLCSGGDFWHTKAIERLGIPTMMMSDGPHGLRKQDETGDHMGINDSIKAVCFPAGCATASSFDRSLVERMATSVRRKMSAFCWDRQSTSNVRLCAAETSSITRKIPTLPAKWQHRSFRVYRASMWAPASSTFMPTIRNTAA